MTSTAAELLAEVKELKKHRGIAYLGEHEILEMINRSSEGYVLLSVHTDWERMALACVVAHPSLPEVPEGGALPLIDPPIWQRELAVHDGVLWQRSALHFDSPTNPLAGLMSDEDFTHALHESRAVRELTAVVAAQAQRLAQLERQS